MEPAHLVLRYPLQLIAYIDWRINGWSYCRRWIWRSKYSSGIQGANLYGCFSIVGNGTRGHCYNHCCIREQERPPAKSRIAFQTTATIIVGRIKSLAWW